MIIREPKFAGRFYPEKPKTLIAMLQDLYNRVEFSHKKLRAKGIILPHGAYHYSGQVAMSVLKCIEIPENIVILAPNHSGLGSEVTIIQEGRFVTPIGDITINSSLAKRLLQEVNYIKDDIKPHIIEHSIEVQLPMMKYMRSDVKIVPLIIKKLETELLSEIISKMASVFKDCQEDFIFLSTSDLSHYVSYDETIRKDKLILKFIEQMDVSGLKKVKEEEKISMCGYECLAINMTLSRLLGASHCLIKRYDTSSTADGNYESVVGYVGACFV
ncbi:MAG: AmmeMemoRadiSam system protein B [Deltaproteobacteria bacterium]|nr:AmmeMemoRadiSam system protein B [Deltaproteobacteria bacterium]